MLCLKKCYFACLKGFILFVVFVYNFEQMFCLHLCTCYLINRNVWVILIRASCCAMIHFRFFVLLFVCIKMSGLVKIHGFAILRMLPLTALALYKRVSQHRRLQCVNLIPSLKRSSKAIPFAHLNIPLIVCMCVRVRMCVSWLESIFPGDNTHRFPGGKTEMGRKTVWGEEKLEFFAGVCIA